LSRLGFDDTGAVAVFHHRPCKDTPSQPMVLSMSQSFAQVIRVRRALVDKFAAQGIEVASLD
jgi:hypothetical protein